MTNIKKEIDIKLDYINEIKEIGIFADKEKYKVKINSKNTNDVKIENDKGKKIKRNSRLYNKVMFFLIQSKI